MTLEEVKKKATNIIYTLNEQIEDNNNLGFNCEELESMQEEIDVIKELLKALEEYEKQLDLDYIRDNYIPKDKVKDILNGTAIIWTNNGKKYVREDKILSYYIPKEKVRELIKSYEHDMKLCDNTDMFESVERSMYEYAIRNLKELLGE